MCYILRCMERRLWLKLKNKMFALRYIFIAHCTVSLKQVNGLVLNKYNPRLLHLLCKVGLKYICTDLFYAYHWLILLLSLIYFTLINPFQDNYVIFAVLQSTPPLKVWFPLLNDQGGMRRICVVVSPQLIVRHLIRAAPPIQQLSRPCAVTMPIWSHQLFWWGSQSCTYQHDQISWWGSQWWKSYLQSLSSSPLPPLHYHFQILLMRIVQVCQRFCECLNTS